MSLNVHPDEIVESSKNGLLAKHPSWGRIRVGEFAEIRNGFAFRSKLFNTKGNGVPIVRIRDVGAAASETFYDGDFDDDYWVEPGDLLIGMDGDFRMARWRGPRSLLNQRVCRVRVVDQDQYDDRFLEHVLQGYLDAIHERTSSVTVKHLSSRTVAQIPVPHPPLDEQRRIVEAIEEQFSRLDAGVGWSRRASLSLNRMRASILKAAVEGRLRGSRTAGSLPDGWVMASPDALAAPERNALAIGPFGSNLKVSDYATTGVPLVFVRSIRRRRFDGGDTKFVTPEKAAELHSHQVEPGDLLITKMGDPPGDAAVYSGSGPAIITADCIKLRPHPDVDVRYLDIAFNSPVARSQILAITRGVAQKKISLGRFRNEVKIPLPPLGEQRAIVTEVERSLSLVEALEGTVALGLAKAESLRRSILGEAFAGRLARAASQRELGSA